MTRNLHRSFQPAKRIQKKMLSVNALPKIVNMVIVNTRDAAIMSVFLKFSVEREGKTKSLLVVRNAGQSIFSPAIRA